MSNTFKVFKGTKDGSIKESTTTKDELTGDQVLLKITASGVCGTDEHYRTTDMVLGHEGVGIVEKLGPGVKYLKTGDRVGFGYVHDSCGHCQQCLKGTETYCSERKMYGMADFDVGSFAHKTVWREAFLFKVPEGLSDEDAAPLMCGGITTFNSLHMYDVQPTDRVGVVGVGGLGHLAIQFAAKMGCQVVVFSGTDSKKDEATRLGATEFHAMKDAKDLTGTTKPIDFLLVTTSAQPDWNLYLPILAPQAKIFPLSVAQGNFEIPYMPLLVNGLTVQGTVVGPRHIHQRMLDFAAHHKVAPVTQTFPMTEQGITDAMQKLKDGKVRYRAVLIPQGE